MTDSTSAFVIPPRVPGILYKPAFGVRTQKQNNSIIEQAVEASNTYEYANNDIKREYLKKIIMLYNSIVSELEGYRGSFGTGYPFYALKSDLTGDLPIIQEQIRYNNELANLAREHNCTSWECERCLQKNGSKMADIKETCRPCQKVDNSLKPRKVINRLPDMDLWMVCSTEKIDQTKERLIEAFKKQKMRTSDVDPIQTIKDIHHISQALANDKMPTRFVPIDTHIIDYQTLLSLIEQVPEALRKATLDGTIPSLDIWPISYRKVWQHDDKPYNFVHDYLSSFTPYNFEGNLREQLERTRSIISKLYTIEQLYNFMIKTGPSSVLRRNETPALKKRFEERVTEWRKL